MASGMESLSGGSSISSFDQSIQSLDSSGDSGSLLGLSVSSVDLPPTPGLKKSDAADMETQTEPPAKKLAMRKVRKAKPGLVASIKGKAKSMGRKAIKLASHYLAKLKRFAFNENFKPVQSGAFDKCSEGTRASLEGLREKYSQKLDELNDLKQEMVGLIDDVTSFRDEHAESLAVMDDPSIAENAKDRMTLTMPGQDRNVEIRAPRLGNAEARHQAIEQFAEDFEGSEGFQSYDKKQDRIEDIRDRREELKSELKDLKDDMLELFKGDMGTRSEEAHSDHSARVGEQSKLSKAEGDKELEEMKKTQTDTLDNLDKEIAQLRKDLSSLDSEERNLKSAANIAKQEIENVKKDISMNQSAMKRVASSSRKSMQEDIDRFKGELASLQSQVSSAEGRLNSIPSEKKADRDKLSGLIKEREGVLKNSGIKDKEKQISEMEKELQKTSKKEDGGIDKGFKKELSDFKKAIDYDR